jgi:DMSO/TMAO reductase YedYZ molybdopterin-dependent catalytic subunit
MSRFRRLALAALTALGIATAAISQTPSARLTLSVSGNVAEPLMLTVDDLRRYPAHAVDYSPRGMRSPAATDESARHYTGCLLRDVLSTAKPTEAKARDLRKSYVVASASDGYEVVFSWAELFVSNVGDNVFIVYERDRTPLPDDEGRVALVTLGDRGPARHVKWLRALSLRTAQ